VKIALVSSIGGHLSELLELTPALEGHALVWITNDPSPLLPPSVRPILVAHAERDWKVLWNLAEFAAIFARERPELMISMGAGPAVPAALVARLAGVPVLYLEPSSAVRAPTLTGRLMRHLATTRWVQWPELARHLRGSRYVGGLL
jgi:UDP-N-acetylglucosamine:LPS N-acetylglucosamine transferase